MAIPETRTSTKRPYVIVNNDDDAATVAANKRTLAIPTPLPDPLLLDRKRRTNAGLMPRFLHVLYNDAHSHMSELSADVIVCMIAPLFTVCNGTRRLPGIMRTDLTDEDMIRPGMQCDSDPFVDTKLWDFYCDQDDMLVLERPQWCDGDARMRNGAFPLFPRDEPLQMVDLRYIPDVRYTPEPGNLRFYPDDWRLYRDAQTHRRYALSGALSLYTEVVDDAIWAKIIDPATISRHIPIGDRIIIESGVTHQFQQHKGPDAVPISNVIRMAMDGAGTVAIMTIDSLHNFYRITAYFADRPPLLIVESPDGISNVANAMMTFTGAGDLVAAVRDIKYVGGRQQIYTLFHLFRIGRGRNPI